MSPQHNPNYLKDTIVGGAAGAGVGNALGTIVGDVISKKSNRLERATLGSIIGAELGGVIGAGEDVRHDMKKKAAIKLIPTTKSQLQIHSNALQPPPGIAPPKLSNKKRASLTVNNLITKIAKRMEVERRKTNHRTVKDGRFVHNKYIERIIGKHKK